MSMWPVVVHAAVPAASATRGRPEPALQPLQPVPTQTLATKPELFAGVKTRGVALELGSPLPTRAILFGENDDSGLYSPTYGKPLELIHIPKAGGSALEGWGNAHGVRWGQFRSWDQLLPSVSEANFSGGHTWVLPVGASPTPSNRHWMPVNCPQWHIPRRSYVYQGGFDPYGSGRTFCAVRHPFSRATSAYNYFRNNLFLEARNNLFVHGKHFKVGELNQTDPEVCSPKTFNTFLQRTLTDMLPGVRAQAAAWPDVDLNLAKTALSSAKDFDLTLSSDPKVTEGYSETPALVAFDCHFLPQWFYARPFANTKTATSRTSDCDVILKEESLDADFAAMLASSGLHNLTNQTLGQTNTGDDTDIVCPELTVKDLEPATVELLAEVYELDFSEFGYEPTVESVLKLSHSAIKPKQELMLAAARGSLHTGRSWQ